MKHKPLCSCKPAELVFRCETCKILHAMFCRDPDCPAGICRAARRYGRVRSAVRVVDSASAVREHFASGLPLDRLVEAECPGCGAELFVTVEQMIRWEREDGEPAALTCSDACAAEVAAELAQALAD
jgi:hypothetical protein